MNLKNINDKIEILTQELSKTNTKHDILQIKSDFNSFMQSLFVQMKSLAIEEKKSFGETINKVKTEFELKIQNAFDVIRKNEIAKILETEEVDISVPSFISKTGSIHPVSFVLKELTNIMQKYGFSFVSGIEIETSYYNFDALNIQQNHPARDMHDTFYLNFLDEKNENYLLRTHTSSAQIRTMEASKLPLAIISAGRTYRCDFDKTHTPMFNQMECLMIDKNINMGNLIWLINKMFEEFFAGIKVETRLRPSFFPFTEPSVEVDINIGNGFLEVMGAGMVHPNVLKNCNIDSNEFSGFAFGVGLERLAMLKYGIEDLRDFFSVNYKWNKSYAFKV